MRKENQSRTRRKTLCGKARTNNKLNPHITPGWYVTRVTLVGGQRSHHYVIPAHDVLFLHKHSTMQVHVTCKSSTDISCVYLLPSNMAYLFRNHLSCAHILVYILNKKTVLLSTFDRFMFTFPNSAVATSNRRQVKNFSKIH